MCVFYKEMSGFVCVCVCEGGGGDTVCGNFRCIIMLTGVAFCWAVDLA